MSYSDSGYNNPVVYLSSRRRGADDDDDDRSLLVESAQSEWVFKFSDPGEQELGSISKEKLLSLEEWIYTTQDPVPTFEDIDQMAKDLWGQTVHKHTRYEVRQYLQTRALNGPPVGFPEPAACTGD